MAHNFFGAGACGQNQSVKTMKIRKILSFVLFLSLSTVMVGRPATRRTVMLTQPDGSTVAVQLHGDEFHHWMTSDGIEVIVGEDGFVVPAYVSEAGRVATMKRAAESRAQRQRSYLPRLRSGNGVHSLVILVEFSDVKFQSAHTSQAFSDMLNKRDIMTMALSVRHSIISLITPVVFSTLPSMFSGL